MTSSSSSPAQGNAQTPLRSSSVAHTATLFRDAFWGPRLQALREQTLPAIYQQVQQDGHFTAFREDWHAGMHPIPYVFWESDISKWIEAASYSLATHPDAQLEALVDAAITFLLTLQQPDGYLNLWFTQVAPEQRWSNLRDYHELYCAGHLIEAAVAHFQATGKRVLLDAVCRYADYIDATILSRSAATVLITSIGRHRSVESSLLTSGPAPTTTISRMSRCGNNMRSWDMPCVQCISLVQLPISPAN